MGPSKSPASAEAGLYLLLPAPFRSHWPDLNIALARLQNQRRE
jgi:hypothetical protein